MYLLFPGALPPRPYASWGLAPRRQSAPCRAAHFKPSAHLAAPANPCARGLPPQILAVASLLDYNVLSFENPSEIPNSDYCIILHVSCVI